MFRTIFIAIFFAAAAVTATTGCKTAEPKPSSYKSMVEQAWQRAEAAYEDDEHLEAIRRYTAIKNRFPYSRYATLAELRLGDVYFAQEKHASAVEQYRGFIKLHPNHEKVVYASYRVALSFFGQMPDNWFFMPPAYEKDLAKAKDAAREFRYFLKRHGDSEYADEARKKLAFVNRRLADHEFYVAKFYLERENPRAAAMRFTYLLENYSGLGLDPQALFLLAKSYILLGDTQDAKAALEDLVEYHPDSSLAADAHEYLQRHQL